MNDKKIKYKISVPLIDEKELERIDNYYNEIADEFLKKFVKEKDLITAQRIMMNLRKENQKLNEEKQELIGYLKDLIDNKYTNNNVVWFDSKYAKTYGELCDMAGASNDRLPLVPLSEIEKILSKIEKR